MAIGDNNQFEYLPIESQNIVTLLHIVISFQEAYSIKLVGLWNTDENKNIRLIPLLHKHIAYCFEALNIKL